MFWRRCHNVEKRVLVFVQNHHEILHKIACNGNARRAAFAQFNNSKFLFTI